MTITVLIGLRECGSAAECRAAKQYHDNESATKLDNRNINGT